MADAENMRAHGLSQPLWLDHFLGFADDQPRGSKQDTQHDNRRDGMQLQAKNPERTQRGALSYTEKENGTVAEHEAMQSTAMNHVASGER